jgi:hypothetical protein
VQNSRIVNKRRYISGRVSHVVIVFFITYGRYSRVNFDIPWVQNSVGTPPLIFVNEWSHR